MKSYVSRAVTLVLAFCVVVLAAVDARAEGMPQACEAKTAAVDAGTVGVVLMHGKGGTPRGPIWKLAAHLKKLGYKVSVPEMPWSKRRRFDRTFDEAMEEIDKRAANLRNEGATHIFVGGQSQGGTAALGYGARRDGLAGVMVIAGGGDPYQIYQFKEAIRASVAEAREKVAAGAGDDDGSFKDLNIGKVSSVRTTARIYLSYLDPEGPALMPRNAAALKGAPLLWVYGSGDPLRDTNNPDYAFAKAPDHPLNAYVVIDAGHKNAPDRGRKVVARWLACVAG